MNATVSLKSIRMLNIPLDHPFQLGFGTLTTLPRVIIELNVESESGSSVVGIGEAAIDFPFVNYDAWDIYSVLSKIEEHQIKLFEPVASIREMSEQFGSYLSAAACYDMAISDAISKIFNVDLFDFYRGYYESGPALLSIGFSDNMDEFRQSVISAIERGFKPKPKVGQGLETDALIISEVAKLTKGVAVFDFNATLDLPEFEELVKMLIAQNVPMNNFLLEQPTRKDLGTEGLIKAKEILFRNGCYPRLIADEVFITQEDAVPLVKEDIILNMKIQKIGGYVQARYIEQSLRRDNLSPVSLVGGTFPTAIGRSYDQHCAACLGSAVYPSDGWLPSTHWFKEEKHLILEDFPTGQYLRPAHIVGPGLGITLNEEKINQFVLEDPKGEYINLRLGNQSLIKLDIAGTCSYQEEYERANNGLSILHNLGR